jgi:hypothetical protein
MADTGKPADRSAQDAQVRDSRVPDARNQPRTEPNAPALNTTVERGHPLAGEPIRNVQHADRAVPHESTTNAPPGPLSPKDRARFEELRAKEPNPNVLPPNVRTEDEEHEFRKLSQVVADADRRAAIEAARPDMRPSPKQRIEELRAKGQHLGEGETHDLRRAEELVRDEKRVAELKAMDKRVEEEDAELAMLQVRVAEARAAGGFDPNG